jgi:predicted transposase YdaD
MKFDSTLKTMLESGPRDWARLFGVETDPVEVIDADIATVSGAADKVIRVTGPPDWILHLEFQAGPDALKPGKLNVYNAVLEDRTGLPVRTVFILLRPAAFLRAYTGRFERTTPGAPTPYRRFDYELVKLWEQPPERLMSGLWTLPLAPLGAVTEGDLPEIIKEMKGRIGRKASQGARDQFWTSTFILMGLRYQEPVIEALFEGVLGMEESVTYQAIIRKGKTEGLVEGARRALLESGEAKFQLVPSKKAMAALNRITDPGALIALHKKVHSVSDWEELLGLPKRR